MVSGTNGFDHFGFDSYTPQLTTAIASTLGVTENKLLSPTEETAELLVINKNPPTGTSSAFSVYSFVGVPDALNLQQDGQGTTAHCHSWGYYDFFYKSISRGLFHDPYYWYSTERDGQANTGPALADAQANTWIHVTEEYSSVDEAVRLWSSGTGPQARTSRHISRRRVTGANPAGYILAAREWLYDDSGNTLPGEATGIAESVGYDSQFRVSWRQSPQALSRGDAALMTQGLVELYEYADATSTEVSRTSIRWGQGTGNPTYTVREFEHTTGRPDLTTAIIDYGNNGAQIRTDGSQAFGAEHHQGNRQNDQQHF